MSYLLPDFKDEAARLRWAIDETTMNMKKAEKKRLHDAMLKLDEKDLDALYSYFRVQNENAAREAIKEHTGKE
jgi:hypothetical protein